MGCGLRCARSPDGRSTTLPLMNRGFVSSGSGKTTVGIIDYRAGNAQSVSYALSFLGVDNRLVKAPGDVDGIDRIILPGVGSAGTTMDYLHGAGWPQFLQERVILHGMPFLGICVGLQVMFTRSEEQDTECLGWLPGVVRQFDTSDLRVPQMGWNTVARTSSHPFSAAIPDDGYFYFVNSYYADAEVDSDIAATTEYGIRFTSAVARKNLMGTQFHIEKSGRLGLELLRRFCSVSGADLC